MFAKQKKAVAKLIAKLQDADLADSDAAIIAAGLFSPDDWRQPFLDAVLPGLAAAVAFGRDNQMAAWRETHPEPAAGREGKEAFDPARDTQEFLSEVSAAEYWQGIQETTAGGIQGIVSRVAGSDGDGGTGEGDEDSLASLAALAVALGLAVDAETAITAIAAGEITRTAILGAGIGDLFDRYTTGSRTATIAENEAANALNYGYLLAMKELLFGGESPAKEWITREDERVRRSHSTIDHAVVGVFDNFEVGGELAPYPRWHGLSAEQRMGCRCRLRGTDAKAEEIILAQVVE